MEHSTKTVSATLWLALTGLFTVYVRIFAAYDRTYGPLAGVVVLLVWFYLLSLAVLLGAEIDDGSLVPRTRASPRLARSV